MMAILSVRKVCNVCRTEERVATIGGEHDGKMHRLLP